MRSKCVLNKNTNPDLRTQTQKLKISKSPFSQTQQYHQILKTHSIKSIQKYNTTNPNKKISNSKQPINHHIWSKPRTQGQSQWPNPPINHKPNHKWITKPRSKPQTKPRSKPPTTTTLTRIGTTTQQKLTHETYEFRTNTVAHSQQTQSTKSPPKIQDQRQKPNAKEREKENSPPPCRRRLGPDLVGLMGSRWADGFQVDGLCDFQVDVLCDLGVSWYGCSFVLSFAETGVVS